MSAKLLSSVIYVLRKRISAITDAVGGQWSCLKHILSYADKNCLNWLISSTYLIISVMCYLAWLSHSLVSVRWHISLVTSQNVGILIKCLFCADVGDLSGFHKRNANSFQVLYTDNEYSSTLRYPSAPPPPSLTSHTPHSSLPFTILPLTNKYC